MCGIVGYVGQRDCVDVLMSGLTKLEYRGYDSAGIAVFDHGKIKVAWRIKIWPSSRPRSRIWQISGIDNLSCGIGRSEFR